MGSCSHIVHRKDSRIAMSPSPESPGFRGIQRECICLLGILFPCRLVQSTSTSHLLLDPTKLLLLHIVQCLRCAYSTAFQGTVLNGHANAPGTSTLEAQRSAGIHKPTCRALEQSSVRWCNLPKGHRCPSFKLDAANERSVTGRRAATRYSRSLYAFLWPSTP